MSKRYKARERDQASDDTPPETPKPKAKPSGTGRRDWLVSDLPRSSFEILDPEPEKTAKRIGFEEALHLVHRRGGWAVLVKRTAKYEIAGKDGPTVLGVEVPKTLFRRGMLHSSVVAHILVQKFGLTTGSSSTSQIKGWSSVASRWAAMSRRPAMLSATMTGPLPSSMYEN